MASYRYLGEKLIQLFAQGKDMEAVLAELRLTPERAVKVLRRRHAQASRKARLILARLQAELVAARFSPSAVTHLVRVMNGEHQSAAMGAALRVLEVGMKKGKRAGVTEKEAGTAEAEAVRPEDVGPMVAFLEEVGKRGGNDETRNPKPEIRMRNEESTME